MPDLADIAGRAAMSGARIVRERGRRLGETLAKTNSVDLVTETDIASGVEVVRAILADCPGSAFVVEEPQVYELAGAKRGTLLDDEVWVVDPIDGTTSYIHGYPCYSVSVGLLRHGRPVAGAVYDVPRDEMFLAELGAGATLQGEAIRCTDQDRLDACLLVTGFPYDRGETLTRQLKLVEKAARLAQGLRRDGSAALDCCHVACGRADAFWELSLQPWDTAAGMLIATEAGAIVTDLRGGAWRPEPIDILVANPLLHTILLDLFA